MSSQVTIPDFLLQYYDKSLDEAAKAGIRSLFRPPHISLDTNRFNLVDEAGNSEQVREFDIEVIVVGVNKGVSRILFDPENPYDPKAGEYSPPLCWSDNGVGPSQNAGSPQNPTCQGCKWSVWGSATSNVSGKGIPACQERKKVAVLYDGAVYQLVIPPNSLKNWQKYADFVGKHPKFTLNMLRTKISFDEKTQGTLTFNAIGLATVQTPDTRVLAGFTSQADFITFMDQLKAQGEKLLYQFTGNDDKPKQDALPAPQRAQAIEAPRSPPPPPQQQAPQQARPQLNGGFMEQASVQAQAPAQAAPKRRGRPPANAVSPPAPAGNGFMNADAPAAQPQARTASANTAFGMQDTEIADDESIDAAVANAMGFDPSTYQ